MSLLHGNTTLPWHLPSWWGGLISPPLAGGTLWWAHSLALIRLGPAALNTGDVTLLLSHSQQLLDSQSQAYANLLCWRPSNLFPLLSLSTGSEGEWGKNTTKTLKEAFFFSLTRFVLLRPHYELILTCTFRLLLYFSLHVFSKQFTPPSLSLALVYPSVPLSLSFSTSVSASNSNSNSNSFIGMTRECLA